ASSNKFTHQTKISKQRQAAARTTTMQVLRFPDSLAPARRLADALGGDCGAIDVHRYPDGESLVTLPPQLADTVVLFRGLEDANARLVELLLACDGARANGARRIILVAPYLCRSEEHTSELQSREKLVCRLLLEKKNSRAFD